MNPSYSGVDDWYWLVMHGIGAIIQNKVSPKQD